MNTSCTVTKWWQPAEINNVNGNEWIKTTNRINTIRLITVRKSIQREHR